MMQISPVVIKLQLSERGLFSELNNLVNFQWYADKFDHKLVVEASKSRHYFVDGWEDFFEPLGADYRKLKTTCTIYRTSELFRYLRAYCSANLTFEEKIKYRQLVRLNQRTSDEVAAVIASLNLPDEYAAIHIRWGDKLVKRAQRFYVPEYVEALPEGTTDVFVMSDDYSPIPTFDYFPYNIHTLTRPDQQGRLADQARPIHVPRSDVIQLLAEAEIATRATHFVGTLSSNVGRWIAFKRGSLDNVTALGAAWRS